MLVEEKYNVAVDDMDIIPDNFDSVSKLADYVRRKTMGELNTAVYLLEFGEDQDIVLLAGQSIYTYHDLRQACARILGVLV